MFKELFGYTKEITSTIKSHIDKDDELQREINEQLTEIKIALVTKASK